MQLLRFFFLHIWLEQTLENFKQNQKIKSQKSGNGFFIRFRTLSVILNQKMKNLFF